MAISLHLIQFLHRYSNFNVYFNVRDVGVQFIAFCSVLCQHLEIYILIYIYIIFMCSDCFTRITHSKNSP